MILPQSRLSRMTLAALATLLGQAGLAHAAPVVGAGTVAAVTSGPGWTSTYQYPDDPPYSYVNSSSGASNTTGESSSYAFANEGGAYAVRAYAYGIGTSSANAEFVNRFYNTSGVAQHYTLSFHIYGGGLGAYLYGYRPLEAGESLISGYSASVKVTRSGGAQTTVFSSAATLTQTDSGFSLSRSGTTLSGADDPVTGIDDGYYGWSDDYYTVNLGIVAAGDFVDVLAMVDSKAISNVGVYSFGSSECGYGSYGGDGGSYGGCNSYVGQAYASYGDPIDAIGHADPDGFVLTASAVAQDLPEPASLALVGLAVGAAGLARRKRRQADGE